MSSIFKLEIKSASGEKIQSRFRVEDDSKTINEVLHDQCQNLKVAVPTIPLNMYVQRKGNPDTIAKILNANDIIEFDHDYFLFDPEYDNTSINAAPDSDPIDFVSTSSTEPESTVNGLPDSPPANIDTDDNGNIERSLAESLPSQITYNDGNKFQFLSKLYFDNKEFMDNKFNELKPDDPFSFYEIDVMEQFSIPRNIAALVLLRHQHLMSYDYKINKVVRDVCQNVLVDIVVMVRQNMTLPRNVLQPLLEFMLKITENEFFTILNTPENPILSAARKRKERQQKKDGLVVAKKKKITFGDADISELNDAANAVAQARTPEEIRNLLNQSRVVRCNWFKSMYDEKKIRIPETVIQKFPELLRDASLLHGDFEYFMQNFHESPVFNVKDAIRRYSTAIITLAKDHKILSTDTVIDENDTYEILKLLIQLMPKYNKRIKRCRIDRLVAESEGSPSVEALTQKRIDIGQKAPMIFLINLNQSKQLYVSTDDVSLKINGEFGDALQALFEMHFVFYLDYAKEMTDVMMLIEHFCELKLQNMPKYRSNLFLDLKAKQN